MNTKDADFAASVERLNALLAWWGIQPVSGNEAIHSSVMRFQQFSLDLHRACGDAHSEQMRAFWAGNDRICRSARDLLHSRRPQDVVAAELEILAALLDDASGRAKGWVELTGRIQICCAAIIGDYAKNLRHDMVQRPSTVRTDKS